MHVPKMSRTFYSVLEFKIISWNFGVCIFRFLQQQKISSLFYCVLKTLFLLYRVVNIHSIFTGHAKETDKSGKREENRPPARGRWRRNYLQKSNYLILVFLRCD